MGAEWIHGVPEILSGTSKQRQTQDLRGFLQEFLLQCLRQIWQVRHAYQSSLSREIHRVCDTFTDQTGPLGPGRSL